jgi:hypothetical protein
LKINFNRVTKTPKVFELTLENILFSGKLYQKKSHQVILEGAYNGLLSLHCDRCGIAYQEEITSPLVLRLTDEISGAKDDLDIIEFLDGIIDITYILQSELNAQKESYNYCNDCSNKDDIEIEL